MFTILCFLVVKKLTENISQKDSLRIFVLFLLFRMKKMVDSSGLSEPGSQGRGAIAHQILANQLTGWGEGDTFMPATTFF